MPGSGGYDRVTAMIDCHGSHMIGKLPIGSFPLATSNSAGSVRSRHSCFCNMPRPTCRETAYLCAVGTNRLDLRIKDDGQKIIFCSN